MLISVAFSLEFCVKPVENPYDEPYLNYAFRKNLESAILESGGRVACTNKAININPIVKEFKETPISYSPFQRVNAYSLALVLGIKDPRREKEFSVSVPYSLPTGSLGDLPRRQAIDDAFGIIYIQLVEHFKRRY